MGLIFCADVTKRSGITDDVAREAFIIPQDALMNE